MTALSRFVAALLVSGVVAACASSTPSPGVPNSQGENRCIPRGQHCTLDTDCCTQWCANNVCIRKPT